MEKKTMYISIPLLRMAEQALDHTYLFKIQATELEIAVLQEKLDEYADSELGMDFIGFYQSEEQIISRRHDGDHQLSAIYAMIDQLEDKSDVADRSIPVRSANDPTSAANLSKLLE
jgi:hypothetical protein